MVKDPSSAQPQAATRPLRKRPLPAETTAETTANASKYRIMWIPHYINMVRICCRSAVSQIARTAPHPAGIGTYIRLRAVGVAVA
jgi:hypothetical protein